MSLFIEKSKTGKTTFDVRIVITFGRLMIEKKKTWVSQMFVKIYQSVHHDLSSLYLLCYKYYISLCGWIYSYILMSLGYIYLGVILQSHRIVVCNFLTFFFFLVRGTLMAYGSSQSRGQIGAAAAGLHYSHSNTRSKPCLSPTLQLTATSDP